jgi:hypothetical protein
MIKREKRDSMFVSLVYCAESTVRWFVVREKYCWMAADCADKSKRTGREMVYKRKCTPLSLIYSVNLHSEIPPQSPSMFFGLEST